MLVAGDTKKVHSDQRRSRRSSFGQPVAFALCKPEGNPRIIGNIGFGVDISSGGLGVTTGYPLKKGDVLNIQLPVLDSATVLPVFSEVIWSIPASEEYRVGLRFLA